jgi:hypothetical protein
VDGADPARLEAPGLRARLALSLDRHRRRAPGHAGREQDAHRRLLGDAWDRDRKLAERYTFEFESVLLYLARWEIVASWVGLDAERGARRFEKLIEEATVEHRDIVH